MGEHSITIAALGQMRYARVQPPFDDEQQGLLAGVDGLRYFRPAAMTIEELPTGEPYAQVMIDKPLSSRLAERALQDEARQVQELLEGVGEPVVVLSRRRKCAYNF